MWAYMRNMSDKVIMPLARGCRHRKSVVQKTCKIGSADKTGKCFEPNKRGRVSAEDAVVFLEPGSSVEDLAGQ